MKRRTFVSSTIASAFTALAGCIDNGASECNGVPRSESARCEGCKKFEEKLREYENAPYTESKATTLETLMRPEGHTCEGNCAYSSLNSEQLSIMKDLNYNINTRFKEGVLNVSVNLIEPLNQLDVEIKIQQ